MKKRLDKVLCIANYICDENPAALVDFVRLLSRKLLSDYMCRAVSILDDTTMPDLEPSVVWFDESFPLTSDGRTTYDLITKMPEQRVLHLGSDIVLPWPWNVSRMASNISCIGEGRPCGTWQYDPGNHMVEYWLPFGIGWVHNGNHSITAGIVQADGVLTTDCVYDISPIFSCVSFDGRRFIRHHDGKVLKETVEFEFAAVFEVGRIMHEHGVSA